MRVIRLDPSSNGDYSNGNSRVGAECCAALRLRVHYAVGIDRPLTADDRVYRAECWVEPENVLCTDEVDCKEDPSWDDYGLMYLRSPFGFLNVEVVKCYCRSDPGCSSGEIVVGRSRIPLPYAFNHEKTRRFPLAKLDGQEKRYAGDISIGMELKRLGMYGYPQFDY